MKNKLIPFKPHPWIAGPHLQTIIGYYLPASKKVGPTQHHLVHLPDGDALVLCENRPDNNENLRGAVLLMHGLGGEAGSSYMLRVALIFRRRGWLTFRLNHRGCGEGRGLARSLYNAGRSEDVSSALVKIWDLYPEAPMIAVGFSLSGNMLLKLLGEDRHLVPSNLRGALTVSPPIDLSLCADALSRKNNRIYDRRFVRMLISAIREREKDFSGFPRFHFPNKLRLRGFDDLCTAPVSGYESADDYYEKCSVKQFLVGISRPTLILASDDDPFIPQKSFDSLPGNEHLEINITRGGGHMGFVSAEKTPLGTHRWMDYAIINYAEKFIQNKVKAIEGKIF